MQKSRKCPGDDGGDKERIMLDQDIEFVKRRPELKYVIDGNLRLFFFFW